MVTLRVDYNKLYMLQGKKRIQLESASIRFYPRSEVPYELTVFMIEGNRVKRKEIKQKTLVFPVPNANFREMPEPPMSSQGMVKYLFASGSKESPTARNWYINYYQFV